MIYGTFYDGRTSVRVPCALRLDSAGSVHLDGAAFEPCAYEEITVAPRVGNIPRLIELPHGARFETANNDAVDRLIKDRHNPLPLFVPHFWESKIQYVALSAVLVLITLVGLVQYGIPYASKAIAYRMPAAYSVMLAERSLENLDRTYFEKSELAPSRQEAIRGMFETHQPSNSGFYFSLHFRKSAAMGANAFALPDGSVVITDELVALAQTDEEILSVIFHEMGHIVHRHALRQALESAGLYAIYLWVVGDLDAVSSVVFVLPAIIIGSKYSRSHEWEADTYSLEQMISHDIDPMHFASIMKTLEAAHEDKKKEKYKTNDSAEVSTTPGAEGEGERGDASTLLDFISSHPSTEERINRFKNASNIQQKP